MLSIEQCSKTLNKNKKRFTETEIIKIRDFLYKISRIVVEAKNTINDEK